jgi:circadian clock protein KaiB
MNSTTVFKFRLYVSSNTPNTVKAMSNLKRFCRTYLAGRHVIEVVDVFKHPKRALTDQIFLTPTLMRLAPMPLRRIIGTLSETQALGDAIGLVMPAAAKSGKGLE